MHGEKFLTSGDQLRALIKAGAPSVPHFFKLRAQVMDGFLKENKAVPVELSDTYFE